MHRLAFGFFFALVAGSQVQRDLELRTLPRLGAPDRRAMPSPPRSYALVVGIGAYEKLPEDKALLFSEADAQDIYSVLISPEGGSFRAGDVHTLIGARATLAALRHELEEWLPSVAGEDSRVVVYFAGHGFVYDGVPYLAPYDVDLNRIASTAYPMERL